MTWGAPANDWTAELIVLLRVSAPQAQYVSRHGRLPSGGVSLGIILVRAECSQDFQALSVVACATWYVPYKPNIEIGNFPFSRKPPCNVSATRAHHSHEIKLTSAGVECNE